MTKAILIDTTFCTGCEACVKACKQEHGLGEDRPRRWKLGIDALSSTRFTTLARREGGRFVRKLCRHCLEPACVSACIVGALQKTPEGPVIYDSDLCMNACPFEIPRYDWEKAVPYVRKCNMCYERLQEGQQPACVESCAPGATLFGEREELITEAKGRIATHPERYVDCVVGETGVGRSSVVYISDVPLDFLSTLPPEIDEPLPALTWAALSKVPALVVGMTGLMGGVWWITERRMRLAEEAAQRSAASEEGEREA